LENPKISGQQICSLVTFGIGPATVPDEEGATRGANKEDEEEAFREKEEGARESSVALLNEML
tara:strand:+ start:1428 stop:1616 length:189 start_codon:yes stop_codon:yes gene_type:complete